MGVTNRTGGNQLDIEQALHSKRHDWPVFCVNIAKFPNDRVAPELVPELFQVLLDVYAPDLLLSLYHELDVAWNVTCLLEEALNGFYPRHQLALVVGRPSAVDNVALDLPAEGIAIPQLERLGRLHVIVVVK